MTDTPQFSEAILAHMEMTRAQASHSHPKSNWIGGTAPQEGVEVTAPVPALEPVAPPPQPRRRGRPPRNKEVTS